MELAQVQELQRRIRTRAHSGVWFPALVIALFVLLSAALYRSPFNDPFAQMVSVPFWAGLPDEQREPVVSYVYWFVGLPVVIALIAAWYRRREQALGLRVNWTWFAAVALGGLGLLAILAAIPVEPVVDSNTITVIDPAEYIFDPDAFLTPLIVVAIAVIVLGWVERSRWLMFAGVWIGVITWWQGAFLGYGVMGGIPGWLSWLLGGGSGPALGGQFALFGLNRPGPLLIVMAAPLLVFSLRRWLRDRKSV